MATRQDEAAVIARLERLRSDARANGFRKGSPLDLALTDVAAEILCDEAATLMPPNPSANAAQRHLIRRWLEGTEPLPNSPPVSRQSHFRDAG